MHSPFALRPHFWSLWASQPLGSLNRRARQGRKGGVAPQKYQATTKPEKTLRGRYVANCACNPNTPKGFKKSGP